MASGVGRFAAREGLLACGADLRDDGLFFLRQCLELPRIFGDLGVVFRLGDDVEGMGQCLEAVELGCVVEVFFWAESDRPCFILVGLCDINFAWYQSLEV